MITSRRHFPHYWRFIRGNRCRLSGTTKRASNTDLSLLLAGTSCWIKSLVSGDLGCHGAHINVMICMSQSANRVLTWNESGDQFLPQDVAFSAARRRLAEKLVRRPYSESLTATQRAHGVMITSPLRQNDVATSFWHNDDVITASCVRWAD